jgi:hypothetical protein
MSEWAKAEWWRESCTLAAALLPKAVECKVGVGFDAFLDRMHRAVRSRQGSQVQWMEEVEELSRRIGAQESSNVEWPPMSLTR